MNDYISIRDLTSEEFKHLLEISGHIKATPSAYAYALKSKSMAMLFEKPSLRTRVSFDLAMQELGGHSLYLGPEEVKLGTRESVHDVAKNLERMVDGIMIRTFAHKNVVELAQYASIPVINGLSDWSHPCQALADYLTMLEIKGRIRGLRIAFVGDGNNVARSLLYGAALLGARFSIATPPGYELDAPSISWAAEQGCETGFSFLETHDPRQAVRDADVVYTDVWASMGQEGEASSRSRVFAAFQVNTDLFTRARPDAMFMHCLPAHRGGEVTDAVIDSPNSFVFLQAENRLHTEKAVLLETMYKQADRMTRRDAMVAWAH